MLVGWHTDNELSKKVLGAIPGIELRHISEYRVESRFLKSVFYGILRGCGRAMHIQKGADPFWYIDNGYYDALYVDKNMHKNMEGKFRIVKNGMHDVYPHEPKLLPDTIIKNVLLIPPSPYSANFYDTTPEDWQQSVIQKVHASGQYNIKIRHKAAVTPLYDDLIWADAVVAFNSMIVLQANKPAYDTHGVFRNFHTYWPSPISYNPDHLRAFYEPRQFTLDEIRQGKFEWN